MDSRLDRRSPAPEPRHGLSRLPPGASSKASRRPEETVQQAPNLPDKLLCLPLNPKLSLRSVKHSIPATPQEEVEAIQSAKQLHVHQPGIVFVPGARLQVQETIDNNWYDCKVIEVDWGELDILVHYQRWSDKYDEWLKMDSKRIRPAPTDKSRELCPFRVGDNVLAFWAPDQQKYPAKVTRVLNSQQCEVLFQDNISKVLPCSKMTKYAGRLPASPDFVLVSSATALTSTTTLVSGTRNTATAAAAAAAAQKVTPTTPADTSKKSIFEVEICEQKRKPKRKAEFVELFDNIKRRKSIHGASPVTSVRTDHSPPPSVTASPSLRSGTRLSLPGPAAAMYSHTTPLTSSPVNTPSRPVTSSTSSRLPSFNTPSRASSTNTPSRMPTTDSALKISASNTPSRTTSTTIPSAAPSTPMSSRSTANQPQHSQTVTLKVAAADESEGPKTRLRAESEQQKKRESGESTVSNVSSTSSSRVTIDSIDITNAEKSFFKKGLVSLPLAAAVTAPEIPAKNISSISTAVSTTSAKTTSPTTKLSPVPASPALSTVSNTITAISTLTKSSDPVRVLGPFARFSNGSGTPGQHLKKVSTVKKPPPKQVLPGKPPAKPGLLAGLSATRRAPMSDDCMLSWEKHGCNVLRQNSFPGWVKQFTRRLPYTGQDSWDVAYFAPDGTTIRNKRDLSSYAEENTLPCLVASFDFSAHGVKEMMLDHMKTCSVGTARGGVSRTIMISPTKLQASSSTCVIDTTSTTTQPLSKEMIQQQTRSMQLRKFRIGQDQQQPQKDVQLQDTPTKSSSLRTEHPSLPIEQPSTVPKLREDMLSEELQLPLPKSPKNLQQHSSPSKLSKPHLTAQSVTAGVYRRKEERGRGFESVEDDPFVDEDDDAGVCSSGTEEEEDNDESEVVSPDVRMRKAAAAARAESSAALHSKISHEESKGQSSSLADHATASEATVLNATPTIHAPSVASPSKAKLFPVSLAPFASVLSASQTSSGPSSRPGRIRIEIPINPDVSRVAEAGDLGRYKPEPVTASRTPNRPRTTSKRDPVTPSDSTVIVLEEHECTVKDCGKTFRKLSLLQMHEKHYHPSTKSRSGKPAPNVADLAYARTVGGRNLLSSSSPITPAQQSKYSQERRSKRHSIGELPETKRRRLDKELSVDSTRQKSTPVGEVPDEPDVPSANHEDSCDVRPPTDDEANNKDDSDYVASKVCSADEDSSDASGKQDSRLPTGGKRQGKDTEAITPLLADSGSDSEDDFMGFPTAPVSKPDLSSASKVTMSQKTAAAVVSAADDTITSAEADDTDVADVTTDLPEDEGTSGHDIINCCCGSMEEEGLMLQCDVCQCWQHAACYAIDQENDVPEKYVCSMCARPRLVRSQHTADHLVTNWLNEAQLPQFSFSKEVPSDKVKQCLRKAHELSKSLFSHSQVLHSLSSALAIAQKTDHPKFVMWHKKWPDPRPSGCKRSETYTDHTPSWLPPLSTSASFSQNQPYNHNPVFSQSRAFNQSLIPTSDLSFTNSLNLVSNSVFSSAPSVLSSHSGLPSLSHPSLNTSINQDDENLLQDFMNFEPLLQSETLTSGVGGFTPSGMATVPSSMLATHQQQIPQSSAVSEQSVSFCNQVSIAATSINLTSASTTGSHTSNTASEAYTMAGCEDSSASSPENINLLGTASMNVDPGKVDVDPPSVGVSSAPKETESDPGGSVQGLSSTEEAQIPEPKKVDVPEKSQVNHRGAIEDNVEPLENVALQSAVSMSLPILLNESKKKEQNGEDKHNLPYDGGAGDTQTLPAPELVGDIAIGERKKTYGNLSQSANLASPTLFPRSPTAQTVQGEQPKDRDPPSLDVSPIKSLFGADDTSRAINNIQIISTSTTKTPEKSESSFNLHLSLSDESDQESEEPSGNLAKDQISSSDREVALLEHKSELISKESESNIRSSSPIETQEGALPDGPVPDNQCGEVAKDCSSAGDLRENAKVTSGDASTKVDQKSNVTVSGFGESMPPELGDVAKNEDTEDLSNIATADDINNLRESESISDIGDSDNTTGLDDTGAMTGLGEGTGFCAMGDAMTGSKPTSLTNSSSENSSDFSTGGHLAHPFTSTSNPSLAEANANLSEANSNLSAANANAADISQDNIMIGANSQSHLEGTENLDADLDASDLGLDLHELLTNNPSLDQLVMPALSAGPSSTDLQSLLPGECGAVSFPEAERIEPAKCRLNLLHHVQAVQDTLEHAYDAIEDQLRKLEEEMGLPELTDEEGETCQDASSRQMVQMVLADMAVVQRLSQYTC